MQTAFSVVIPLYNKKREIARALHSVLAQTLPAAEILVVDDGSTDGSAAEVERIGSPLVRLIRQENRGVSAARNCGLHEARSPWVALLDGDDWWHPGYLAEIARLIERYPDCGAYATGFTIASGRTKTPARTPEHEGVVDFFAESMTRFVLIPSTTTLNRKHALALGGFPEGMRLGEDLWFWIRLARTAPVGFSPARLVCYAREASNRSVAIWRAEQTVHSFEELHDPSATELSNEYVARAALGKALTLSSKGATAEAARTARFFAGTRRSRFLLWKVRTLNALPARWRPAILSLYNRLAWLIARKGV